jgi:predicted Zn-dependent protease
MRRLAYILTASAVLLGGCVATFTTTTPVGTLTVRGATPEADADHLAKAAACIDRGDETAAVPHLSAHVTAQPDAVMIRAYLAELLLKLGRLDESRRHFERYTHDAAGMSGQPGQHLVHCHTRLMEIAGKQDDTFRESLHRGIGLVLLVRQWDAEPSDTTAEDVTTPTLAKAAAALREARAARPTDPRPLVYLAEVYARQGQPSAARSAARRAASLLPDAGLTDAERTHIERLCE